MGFFIRQGQRKGVGEALPLKGVFHIAPTSEGYLVNGRLQPQLSGQPAASPLTHQYTQLLQKELSVRSRPGQALFTIGFQKDPSIQQELGTHVSVGPFLTQTWSSFQTVWETGPATMAPLCHTAFLPLSPFLPESTRTVPLMLQSVTHSS